uniref:Protein transport protein Sec31A n=1 Tax=Oryzias sinensis TaxID=183150 RepID=A0A8C7XDL2_9TELE
MRLKEIQRTAHQAWSPSGHHPIFLALGTSAQQLDASFNTTAAIEIFQMDFTDPSLEMQLKGSIPTPNSVSHFFRLHSIVWVDFGMGADETGGRLICGSENGLLTVYKPEAIMNSGADALVGQSDKHTGPVRALDFNPFQSNLLASGANDSEIFIWDLNNFNSPMTPGAKTQPAEDISVVSWNRQVQHILASATPSGKAVVWDLRKNEPIIKISDHSNRMHCSGMLWHPDVATQLVLASEDDRLPVIQMWDLRFATSPLKVFENHTRGILSISWSQADSELLLSSAKDNRILCWNPNTGEVIYELPTTNQWCFDVQWCPRNPALLSTASFDGRISVYSVMGGSLKAQQQSTADKISSSFDTMDPFGTGQVLPPLQVPLPHVQDTIVPPLKKPPKWVRRPVGASFAFGGKLITFENPKQPLVQSPQPVPRQVFMSQVTTETELLQRSRELQAALQSGSFNTYCQTKIQNAKSDTEQDIWKFLLVNFEDEARVKFLKLLGFSKDELERKVCLNCQPNGLGVDAKDLAEKMQRLSTEVSDSCICIVFSGLKTVLFAVTRSAVFRGVKKELNLEPLAPSPQQTFSWWIFVPGFADSDGLISQALLVGNFEGAVELCLNDGRYAEAILLSISGGEELKRKNSISMLISSVVTQNWRDIVQCCELDNWKEALAALLTYAHPEDFALLCDILGNRLEHEGTEKRCLQACLCYICSGNIEKLVECWALHRDCSSPLGLEDLVEKVMMLRKSIERLRNNEVAIQSPILAEKLTSYAGILAAEGSLSTAMAYLPENSDQNQFQPPAPSPVAPPQQPQIPSVFTPQAPPPNPGSGLPPTSHVHHPSSPPSATRPSYPQHPSMPPGQSLLLKPLCPKTLTLCSLCYFVFLAGIPSHQPFQPQPVSAGGPFPPTVPSIPAPSLAGPQLPPLSSTPGGLPPMPSPGVPPTGFMPSTSLPSGFMPPNSQPGAPVPMYPGNFPNQGPPAPLMSPGHFTPAGPGYPQGGPGAPAVKPPNSPMTPPKSPPELLRSRVYRLVSKEALFFSHQWPHAPLVDCRNNPNKPFVAQLLQQLPAERVEQKEIPSEHVILKTTFDSLVQRCQLAAGDPQTKRKLDDAGKRLGNLYDKLREQSLSPNILNGLHEISRCVSSQNYQRALEVHTQVVSSSNFSEISAFMPILKVVITTANKLGV